MPLDASPEARGFFRLPLRALRRETADAISLELAVPPDLAERFRFRPGQYLTFRVLLDGEDVRRSYSICSLPGEALRVAIKRVEEGRFSSWAHAALAAGADVEVMPPAGRFVLPPATGPRHVLAVAAGSGITPVLSMLAALLAAEDGARATLLYGSRSTAEILFREELEALKDRYLSRLTVLHVLSREAGDVPVLHGRLDAARVAVLSRGIEPDLVLLCGPAALIDGVSAHFLARGLPPDRVLSERFAPAGTAAPVLRRPSPAAAATAAPRVVARVIADGQETTVAVADDETLLDAALRAGLDLPFSCRAGMCSTCRARITAGGVAMDVNYGLEPWETDAGYVLTCQARPTTEQLTVDYDAV